MTVQEKQFGVYYISRNGSYYEYVFLKGMFKVQIYNYQVKKS